MRMREFWIWKFTVDNVKVGSANGAGGDFDEDLVRCGKRSWNVGFDQWFADFA